MDLDKFIKKQVVRASIEEGIDNVDFYELIKELGYQGDIKRDIETIRDEAPDAYALLIILAALIAKRLNEFEKRVGKLEEAKCFG